MYHILDGQEPDGQFQEERCYLTIVGHGTLAHEYLMRMLINSPLTFKVKRDVPELNSLWVLPQRGTTTVTFSSLESIHATMEITKCFYLLSSGIPLEIELKVYRDNGRWIRVNYNPIKNEWEGLGKGPKADVLYPVAFATQEVTTAILPGGIEQTRVSELDQQLGDAYPAVHEFVQKALLAGFVGEFLRRTSNMMRYGGMETIHQQSVLEHCGGVTTIAMSLAGHFNHIGIRNDTTAVLTMSLLHDADEMFTGDIPHDAKYDFKVASEKLRKTLAEFGDYTLECTLVNIRNPRLHDKYMDLVRAERERVGIEALIVKLADNLEVVMFAQSEVEAGNALFCEIEKRATVRSEKVLRQIVDKVCGDRTKMEEAEHILEGFRPATSKKPAKQRSRGNR